MKEYVRQCPLPPTIPKYQIGQIVVVTQDWGAWFQVPVKIVYREGRATQWSYDVTRAAKQGKLSFREHSLREATKAEIATYQIQERAYQERQKKSVEAAQKGWQRRHARLAEE